MIFLSVHSYLQLNIYFKFGNNSTFILVNGISCDCYYYYYCCCYFNRLMWKFFTIVFSFVVRFKGYLRIVYLATSNLNRILDNDYKAGRKCYVNWKYLFQEKYFPAILYPLSNILFQCICLKFGCNRKKDNPLYWTDCGATGSRTRIYL